SLITHHSFTDLQAFLQYLEGIGELKRIRVEVDPKLEITEIACRVVREEGPALLFERVKGSQYPLGINSLGTAKRIELALGRHPEEIGEELVEFVKRMNPPSIRKLWSSRSTIQRLLAMRGKRVESAPCQEVVEEPDLDALPILTCWPEDGGRFLTLPLVFTRDPQTGLSNLGIYRMHVYAKDRTGMHWQIQKGGGFHYYQSEKIGKELEVAVVLGGDPILLLTAMMPLPEALEEIIFAGFLRGKPTPLVKARTLSLHIPASGEFVLEGVVPSQDREMEGPFGDHFGHYSSAAPFPIFHIKAITRKRNPIYPAAVVGKPPQEDRYMGDAVQEILKPLIKLMHPELNDLWAYFQTGFHNLLVASIEVRYTKESMKTAMALLGEGQLSLTKCLILVSPEVDVKDFRAVLRAVRDHFEPQEDFILISRAHLDTLDFTSFKMHLGSRMILDATKKGDPRTPSSVERLRDPREVDSRIVDWRLLEGTLLVIKVTRDGREVIGAMLKSEGFEKLKMIAAVSSDIDLEDDVTLLWGIFTRFDPARDILFRDASLMGIWPIYRGTMAIDATFKQGYPNPLEMPEEVRERVSRRWGEYGI
ncbi:MAG: menaquinone biosynthesis decarboxylase, partial [Candidatus Tectomicrobia bacterium]|nr:menaquinone biosynthesis decarboxylase [Candidatus Tectomicrobia bacterium]